MSSAVLLKEEQVNNSAGPTVALWDVAYVVAEQVGLV